MNILNGKKLILASKSPRRSELLSLSRIEFEVIANNVVEDHPFDLHPLKVAEFLANEKSAAFIPLEDQLILTADTVVINKNKILGKPQNYHEAFEFLSNLSDGIHQVVTGFALKTKHKSYSESVVSEVSFDPMSEAEIKFYIEEFSPYDKAGGYGIQEWIGFTKVNQIVGSYNNIIGLPTREVYRAIINICQ